VYAVINELAPGARATDWPARIGAALGTEVVPLRVWDFASAYQAARAAALAGAELIVAVGGDGTVNACAGALRGSRAHLAVVPAGTANDLARILAQRAPLAQAAEALAGFSARAVDTISVSGVDVCTAGGVGWVADVADTANRWRRGGAVRRRLVSWLGPLVYTLACLAVILRLRRRQGRYRVSYVDADSGVRSTLVEDAGAVLVTNGTGIGGSFHLAPDARADDGRFELVVLPRVSRLGHLRLVLAARRGRLLGQPGVRCVRARAARIVCEGAEPFLGDGELLRRERVFDLWVRPGALRVWAPPVAAAAARPAPLDQAVPAARTGDAPSAPSIL
jgi:diacylglycerol kinase (ATP)